MVLDDFPSKTELVSENGRARPSGDGELFCQLASPLDRLAAWVADLILFVPVVTLVSAPFSRAAKEASLSGNEAALNAAMAWAVVGVALSFVLYQTIFIAIWGATPGKLALRLRVVSVRRAKKPTWSEAFARALSFVFEGAFGGIAWLSVFSTEQRRPLHDRVAETVVIHLRKARRVGQPTLSERAVARGFQAALFAAASVMVISQVQTFVKNQNSRSGTQSGSFASEPGSLLCSEVRDELELVPNRNPENIEDRLHMALALFAASELDADCLDSEAEYALWKNQATSLAYLAKGWILVSDDDLSSHVAVRKQKRAEKYFTLACDREGKASSDECVMIDMIQAQLSERADASHRDGDRDGNRDDDREQAPSTDQALRSVSPSSASFVRLAALRELMDMHDPMRALDALSQLETSRSSLIEGSRKLGVFLAKSRVKALWETGAKQEARSSIVALQDVLEAPDRVDLSRWLCSSEISSRGCNLESQSACQILTTSVNRSESWLMNPDVAAVYVRNESCRISGDSAALRRLKERLSVDEGKLFLEALALSADGHRKKAIGQLKSILDSPTLAHGQFFLEAGRLLTDFAESAGDLQPVLKYWEQLDSGDENRILLGQSVIRKLNQLAAFEGAFKLALKLSRFTVSDQDLLEQMVIAAEGSGHMQMATELRQSLALQAGAASRQPASDPSGKTGDDSKATDSVRRLFNPSTGDSP